MLSQAALPAQLESTLRILLISDYSDCSGGVEELSANFRSHLRSLGHEVSWFSSNAGTNPRADILCYGTTSRFRGFVQAANVPAAFALRRAIQEFRPDVIHIGMMLTQLSPSILPVLKRIPTVYYAQWYRSICLTGTRTLPDGTPCSQRAGLACLRSGCLPFHDWLPLHASLVMFRRWTTGYVVANSEHVKQEVTKWGVPVQSVIPSAVKETPLRPPLDYPPSVVFAGRLVKEKGAEFLLNAFRKVAQQLPDAQLLVAGDGPEISHLHSLATGLHVHFTGWMERPELERLFASAWVQAVPSLWQEPFGLTAAEALMRGTAVVATGCGGLREIVIDGVTGFLTPPGDPEDLAAALLKLLQNRELAEDMGRAGRADALRRFSIDTFTNRFLDCYRALAAA